MFILAIVDLLWNLVLNYTVPPTTYVNVFGSYNPANASDLYSLTLFVENLVLNNKISAG